MSDERPHLDEGCTAAPGISPGVVCDHEYLLRELYYPEHTGDDSDIELKERAITVTQLMKTGFSVHRKRHVGAECVEKRIEDRLAIRRKDKPWRSLGIAKLQAKEIRTLRLDDNADEQVLVVVDTATVNEPWHASIFAKHASPTRSHCRELRARLLPLLNRNRMSVEKAYGNSVSRFLCTRSPGHWLQIWFTLSRLLKRIANWWRAYFHQ